MSQLQQTMCLLSDKRTLRYNTSVKIQAIIFSQTNCLRTTEVSKKVIPSRTLLLLVQASSHKINYSIILEIMCNTDAQAVCKKPELIHPRANKV